LNDRTDQIGLGKSNMMSSLVCWRPKDTFNGVKPKSSVEDLDNPSCGFLSGEYRSILSFSD